MINKAIFAAAFQDTNAIQVFLVQGNSKYNTKP